MQRATPGIGRWATTIFTAALIGTARASAQSVTDDPAPATTPPEAPPAQFTEAAVESGSPDRSPGPFRLTFAPYAWLASYSGTAGALGLKFDVDKSFSDIIDESDQVFGLMGALDMNYKRFVFQVNGTYSEAEFSGERGRAPQGPNGGGLDLSLDGTLKVQAGWYEAMGGYRFIDREIGDPATSTSRFTLAGVVGGRFTDMEIEQDVTARATITLPDGRVLEAGRSRSLDQDKGWFEPFLGARAGLQFGEHWGLLLHGDVGGFDLDGSQFAWQALGLVAYQWRREDWSFGLYAGFRALGQDYSEDGFTWDMVTYGPIVGVGFSLFF